MLILERRENNKIIIIKNNMVKPYTYIHTRTSSELRKRRQECRNRKDCLVKNLANFYIKHLWVKNPSISSDPLTENLHYWLENFLGKLSCTFSEKDMKLQISKLEICLICLLAQYVFFSLLLILFVFQHAHKDCHV